MTGKFPITLTAGNHPPTTVYVVLGDQYPALAGHGGWLAGLAGEGVEDRLSAAETRAGVLEAAGWIVKRFGRVPGMSWLAALRVGWLTVYILAYLPTLFLFRAVLKLA